MAFEDRYETDARTACMWWREYVWAVHRGVQPSVRMQTAHAKFNTWLENSGRQPVPLPVFRGVWLGRC